jgi:hypothetical protein
VTSALAETVILCEGWDDRAFWQGWLTRLGCQDIRSAALPGRDVGVDPSNDKVRGEGHHGYRTPMGGFIRVIPVHGDDKVISAVPAELIRAEARDHPVERIVVCVDGDAEAKANGLIQRHPSPQVPLELAIWKVGPNPPADERGVLVPAQETLERVVCAGLALAHPNRARWLFDVLATRPEPGGKPHKVHCHAWFSMWFSESTTNDFFSFVWRDPAIAAPIEQILEGTMLTTRARSWAA